MINREDLEEKTQKVKDLPAEQIPMTLKPPHWCHPQQSMTSIIENEEAQEKQEDSSFYPKRYHTTATTARNLEEQYDFFQNHYLLNTSSL